MEIAEIKKIIKMLKNTEVSEMEIHQGTEAVRIRLSPNQSLNHPENQTASNPDNNEQEAASLPINDNKHYVKATVVGTAMLCHESGNKPFVEVGQSVKKGDILCLILIMNMPNAIEADKAGKIIERHIEEGSRVEYGQTLFTIEQDG